MSEKIVLTEQEAAVVEAAKNADYPAFYISDNTDATTNEAKLMQAYVNGYTTDEQKYKVFISLPGSASKLVFSLDSAQAVKCSNDGIVWQFANRDDLKSDKNYLFTTAELAEYGLTGCQTVKAGE